MKLLTVVGARPQFVKLAPLSLALRRRHREIIVHSGQHYDDLMSDVFFADLDLPAPDHHLGVGSGRHGAQTGALLIALGPVLDRERPDAVVVVGDTNTTLAAALAASKLHVPVAHVEAGLRSFNRAMPEEINRVAVDHLATWLFAPSESARRQLASEGIVDGVHVVGDVMLDALLLHRSRALGARETLARVGVEPGGYYLATVHRAENTDDAARLRGILRGLGALDRPVLLPLHPRTRRRMAETGLGAGGRLRPIEPLSYVDMLALNAAAACVLTDSGGVQKEAYYLGVPCVTLRDETEWTETVATGWNALAGADPERIAAAVARRPALTAPRPPLYGDGRAAERIAAVLAEATR
jgi:UDP-N-acetylglucosamine 2-epimerase